MSNIINKTSTDALSVTMQEYYDRKLIHDMAPKLVHYQFGQKRPLPKNNGKTIRFRKWTPFAAITDPLTEGVVPAGQNLAMTEVYAEIAAYGDYVAVTDMLDLTALDPVINDSVELMANQAGLSIDALTRDELLTGTNVQYAGGKTARSAITTGDVLTTTEIRKAVRTLRKNKAKPFEHDGGSHFIAIVSPDALYDLQNDALWQDVAKYQDAEAIYSGEIGRMFGVRFVETTEAGVFKGAGASGADVLATLVFGADAYGVVEIEGSGATNANTIVKPAGSAGSADPLNQISTVGWKVAGYAAKILQPSWMVRIEHGASDAVTTAG